MKNYRDQTPRICCLNCRHGVVNYIPDEYHTLCCSVSVGDNRPLTFGESRDANLRFNWDEWFKFEGEFLVADNGICDLYEKQDGAI